jgi:preprotein translocase subunit SecG
MKKKLSIASVFLAIIICITLIIYIFIQKEDVVNIEKEIEEKENIIQEYHGTVETHT